MTDSDSLVPEEDADDSAVAAAASSAAAAPAVASAPAAAPAAVAEVPVAAASAGAPSGAAVADIPFKASDAIATLLAYSAKVRPDQIGESDTTDTLTNGVSSRRNQLLMDISSELGVASVDGAAEATVKALSALVNKVAPNYKAFGPVLSDIVRDRVRGMFGAAGVKLGQITKRVTDTWQLGEGWTSHVVAALVLETREGASSRGGDLASLSTDAASNAAAANALIDAAVQKVAADKGLAVAMPSAGGAAGGAVVDSAALDAFAAKVTGADGVLASTAKFVLNQLGVAAPVAEETADENAAVVAAVEAELGADWPKQVEPRFDERKAILFDDRWASAREDLARAYYNNDESALNGSFIGLGKTIADEAAWYAARATTRI